MPSLQEHLKQAALNEAFAQSLRGGQFEDWRVTAIFYAALHYVEAYFATQDLPAGLHFSKHARREDNMADYDVFDPIYEDYKVLKTASERSRYSRKVYSTEQIDKDFVPLLEKIKSQITAHLPPEQSPGAPAR